MNEKLKRDAKLAAMCDGLYVVFTKLIDDAAESFRVGGTAKATLEMDLFLKSGRFGAKGLGRIFIAMDVWEEAPEESDVIELGLFCAYIMLAQHRAFSRAQHMDEGFTIVTFFRDALELFALTEGRAFKYLSAVDFLIRTATEFVDREQRK